MAAAWLAHNPYNYSTLHFLFIEATEGFQPDVLNGMWIITLEHQQNVHDSIYTVLYRQRLFKEMYTFIQQGFVKYNKSDNNVIYNLTKDLYFKSILLFLLITESRKKMISLHKTYLKAQLNSDTTVKIDTKLFIYFSEQQISIQNHQSNAENPDLHHRNQFNLKMYENAV